MKKQGAQVVKADESKYLGSPIRSNGRFVLISERRIAAKVTLTRQEEELEMAKLKKVRSGQVVWRQREARLRQRDGGYWKKVC